MPPEKDVARFEVSGLRFGVLYRAFTGGQKNFIFCLLATGLLHHLKKVNLLLPTK